jgi:hypothetical protein
MLLSLAKRHENRAEGKIERMSPAAAEFIR